MGLGHQRLDAKDSRESTVSRVQDRPPLLVLTEGLAGAARQLAISWPAVPVEGSGVPVESGDRCGFRPGGGAAVG